MSSGDAGEIKADGPIASYLCVASSSSACGIMDHYCLLCASTNMLLNLVPKAYKGEENPPGRILAGGSALNHPCKCVFKLSRITLYYDIIY